MSPSENLRKLAPFLLRSRGLEVGRERLLQVRNKLLFLLVTEDLSDNSLKKLLREFACPVVQCFRSGDVEELFGFRGTKVLGFRRSALGNAVLQELSACRLHSPGGGGVLAPRPLPSRPRVAVLGVHGIGRFHAGWWSLEGARVTSFLCSSPASIPGNVRRLREVFPFEGNGYSDLEELLRNESPDILDVCLPDALHHAAVRRGLEAGCHVLCEKPFIYDAALPSEQILRQAEEVTALAERKRCLLGVSAQYAVAVRKCLRLRRDQTRDTGFFDGLIVSPGRPGGDAPWKAWYDLAPHYIVAAQICARTGRIRPEDLRFTVEDSAVVAEFACPRPGSGRLFRGRITTRYQQDPPLNLRRIRLDDETFTIDGFHGPDGVFQMSIDCNGRKTRTEDTLRLLIRSFLDNHLEVPARTATDNLAVLLAARRT